MSGLSLSILDFTIANASIVSKLKDWKICNDINWSDHFSISSEWKIVTTPKLLNNKKIIKLISPILCQETNYDILIASMRQASLILEDAMMKKKENIIQKSNKL